MNKNTITTLTTSFDAIQQTVPDSDVEFWNARDLQGLLGYAEWRNFLKVIGKAKEACLAIDVTVENHFVDVNKMVKVGSGAERFIDDIMLTSYAKGN